MLEVGKKYLVEGFEYEVVQINKESIKCKTSNGIDCYIPRAHEHKFVENKDAVYIESFESPLDSKEVSSRVGFKDYVNIETVNTNKGLMWYVSHSTDEYNHRGFVKTVTNYSSVFAREDDAWEYYDKL